MIEKSKGQESEPDTGEGFFSRMSRVFGWRVIMWLSSVFFLVKGLQWSLVTSVQLPFFKGLGLDGVSYQTNQSITSIPWAMKGMVGFISDCYPIGGYNKRWYLVIFSLLGAVALCILSEIPRRIVLESPWVVAIFYFFISFQVSSVDLLSEGKYSELIRSKPKVGSSMVSYVWGSTTIGALIGALIIGPAADNAHKDASITPPNDSSLLDKPAPLSYLFLAVAPLAAQLIIPAMLNWLPELKTKSTALLIDSSPSPISDDRNDLLADPNVLGRSEDSLSVRRRKQHGIIADAFSEETSPLMLSSPLSAPVTSAELPSEEAEGGDYYGSTAAAHARNESSTEDRQISSLDLVDMFDKHILTKQELREIRLRRDKQMRLWMAKCITIDEKEDFRKELKDLEHHHPHGVVDSLLGDAEDKGDIDSPESVNMRKDIFKLAWAVTITAVGLAFVSMFSNSNAAKSLSEDWNMGSSKRFVFLYVVCACVICGFLNFKWLPKNMAQCNFYMFLSAASYIQIPGALDYFYTAETSCVPDGPHFDNTFYISYTSLMGTVSQLAGVLLFQFVTSKWTFRHAFWITTIVSCMAAGVDLVIVKRFNHNFGIDDKTMYWIGSACILQLVAMLNFMPGVLLNARLCPQKAESASFAILAGFSNLGGCVSQALGAFLIAEAGIKTNQVTDGQAFEPAKTIGANGCNFDNLPYLILFCHMLLPLVCIPMSFLLIPNITMDSDVNIHGDSFAAPEAIDQVELRPTNSSQSQLQDIQNAE